MKRLAIAIGILLVPIAARAENGANDYLLSIDGARQAAMLGKVVGTGCTGRTAFYQGIGKTGFAKDKAFWNVRCSDRREFTVQVNPDGSSSVVDCAMSKLLHVSCFKKFKQ